MLEIIGSLRYVCNEREYRTVQTYGTVNMASVQDRQVRLSLAYSVHRTWSNQAHYQPERDEQNRKYAKSKKRLSCIYGVLRKIDGYGKEAGGAPPT